MLLYSTIALGGSTLADAVDGAVVWQCSAAS
jgi:hypothetical protein